MSKINKVKYTREALLALIGGTALLISGCTGSEDALSSTQLSSPKTIASESADNYDDNEYGLITAPTLKSWIDNWEVNKPAGIRGKLVILQTQSGPAGFEYIKPNGNNVFTHEATEWVQTRNNGVVQTKSMVPDGSSMDAFLVKYDIDPLNDMIVCGMGTGGASQAMRAGRCWYMFRYWGTAKENLSVLNGGNEWIGNNTALDANYFTTTPSSTSWITGGASVKDLPENNFALQATLEDMMNVVPDADTNILDDGVFIWDARSTNQYSPTVDADFQSGGVQGHPNGALVLPYNNLLDSAAGYTYKPKAEIASYMTGAVDGSSVGFMDSTVQAVGEGSAYQAGDVIYTYCETTYRAMITGFASASILGLPTRFYDGAMTEWHAVSAVPDSGGDLLMPLNSPWRTDIVSRSMFLLKVVPVAPPTADDSGYITGAFATSANKIIEEDKAYKGLISSLSNTGSSGGGASIPANPCGG